MGTVDEQFARDLRRDLDLQRAVETGTFEGGTSRLLSTIFPAVVTIEQSPELHARATANLADVANVTLLQGHSVDHLRQLAGAVPTLYYLDAHWSGGLTSGVGDECPVLREIEAVRDGHPEDCIVIDDARLFAAAHPPPQDPAQWPSLAELFDALRDIRTGHYVTVINDQVIGIPARAKDALNVYAWRVQDYPAERLTLLDRIARSIASVTRST